MADLQSYQWRSTVSQIHEPLFGGDVQSGSLNIMGAWRSEGDSLWSQSVGNDFTITFITIDGVSIIHNRESGRITVLDAPSARVGDVTPASFLNSSEWTLLRSETFQERDVYVLADGPELEYPVLIDTDDSFVSEATNNRTIIYVDAESFLVTRRINESRTTRRPEIAPFAQDSHDSRTRNSLLFAFNEPVEIEFPEGFQPD